MIFEAENKTIFFLDVRKKNIVPRNKILQLEKKKFCHYIKEKFSWHQKTFPWELVVRNASSLTDLIGLFGLFYIARINS